MPKVNLKDIESRLARRKAKPKPKPFYDVKCVTYDTPEEIAFMMAFLRMKVITSNHKGIDIDLGEERLFLRLNQINQLKLIIGLLQSEINVVIDGSIEQSNDENINDLKAKLSNLEQEQINDQIRKQQTLEKLMWLRYGTKKPTNPDDKKKELEEFNKQIQAVRKAKGLE